MSPPPAKVSSLFAEQRVPGAPARAARGEEEPVHEDAVAVVVGVVGQEPVPLVLLLALAVAGAAEGGAGAGKKRNNF